MFVKKSFIIFSIAALLGVFSLLNFVDAVKIFKGEVASPKTIGIQGVNVEEVGDIVKILIKILRWTYTVFFIIAVLYIIFAAYTYLTANEQPEKIKSAHNQLIYAAIAIAIALLAVSATMIVKSIISPSGSGGGGVQTSGTTSPIPNHDTTSD